MTKTITVRRFNLSASDFQQIVKASYHVENLIIWECKIHWPIELDFSNPSDSKLISMHFNSWRQYVGNKLIKFTPSSFECIIKAIAKWKIKFSIKILSSYSWGFNKKKLKPLLIKHGLENVETKEDKNQIY